MSLFITFLEARIADARVRLIMTADDVSLCQSGFRRKQILRALQIHYREKHFEMRNCSCWWFVHGGLRAAEESSWLPGKGHSDRLNPVIFKEKNRKN